MLPYISIFGRSIPLYGLCLALGVIVSSCVAILHLKKRKGDINSLIVIAACGFGFALAGAKILYILVSYGLWNAISAMLRGDFSILSGSGLVFYGGLIGAVPGGFFGAWLVKEKLYSYCDVIIPCIPLGHAFGRVGCHFAGCCYGFAYDGIFCTSFPAAGVNHTVFPVQLLEAFLNLALFFYLMYYVRKPRKKYFVLYQYLMLYAIIRFFLEFARGDEIRGISNGLSTSQWISVFLFAISILLPILRKSPKMNR